MKSVLILEDAADVRSWLVEIIQQVFTDATIIEAETLTVALESVDQQPFDLALIDLNLPDGNGLSLLQKLQECSPDTYAVIATIFDDDENIIRALKLGAQGYLLKQESREYLISSLNGILAGEPPLSSHVARRILSHFRELPQTNDTPDPGLSPRETEILTFIAKGLNRGEIAQALGISTTTVATHIGSVYRKLNVGSRSEATLEAVRLGLIKP